MKFFGGIMVVIIFWMVRIIFYSLIGLVILVGLVFVFFYIWSVFFIVSGFDKNLVEIVEVVSVDSDRIVIVIVFFIIVIFIVIVIGYLYVLLLVGI